MRKIKFTFANIPADTRVLVGHQGAPRLYTDRLPAGDHAFEVEFPDGSQPLLRVICREYTIPEKGGPIGDGVTEYVVTGADYYVDVSRPDRPEAQNLKSIESLIYQVSSAGNLNGRQHFYTALIALESYLEYLTYGMLVLSEHWSETKYRQSRQEVAIKAAFDGANTDFFTTEVVLCPGKTVQLLPMDATERAEWVECFDTVRKLRNQIVHSWGSRDISRADLEARFNAIGEMMNTFGTDEEFYTRETFLFTRLYARANNRIGNQLTLFNERAEIRRDREERGY